MNGAGIWPPDRIAELRELAATGLSAAAIGELMGATKCGVIGKCRRAGIPLLMPNHMAKRVPRPVPVAAPPVVVSAPVATLPPLASLLVARKPPVVPKVPEPTKPPVRRAEGCQWIEGTGAPWQCCGKPVWRFSAWCEPHYKRVYVRHRDMRDERDMAAA